jgi:hypothetical protein
LAAATTSTEATTVGVGDAPDNAFTNINQNNAEFGSSLSSGAKIGFGIGVGVGAAAVLAGLLLFFVLGKRNPKEDEKGWFGDRQEGWNPDAGDAYKEPGFAYPKADFDSHNSYAFPTPAFIGNHFWNQSIKTIAPGDLAFRTPMGNFSSFSYASGGPGVGGIASPYWDDMSVFVKHTNASTFWVWFY